MKKLFVVLLMSVATSICAQTSPAKKELVAKVLLLQQPAIEGVARALAEQPAALLMQSAGTVMQTRTPPDKREAIAREIQADVKKYVDEAVPLVRDRAVKLAPVAIGTMLDERFTEEELVQLIAIIESPVNRKFQQMGGEMQKNLQDRLVAETKGLMEPKIKALQLAVAGRLGIPVSAPAASSGARAPASPASK